MEVEDSVHWYPVPTPRPTHESSGKDEEGAGAMFCICRGTECLLSAKVCGHCGHRINGVTQNTTKKVHEGGASGGTSVPLTFKQFKSKKEEDRKGYFRNNSGNKRPLKKARLGQPSDSEVKINIGVMILRDGGLNYREEGDSTSPYSKGEYWCKRVARESGGKTPSLQQRCCQEWQ